MNPEITHVTCKYCCDGCGLVDVDVEVPARPSLMDVVEWVERVIVYCVAADHICRSPQCTSQEITQIKIPVPKGSPYIGSPSIS
jgi:hypothetical protein